MSFLDDVVVENEVEGVMGLHRFLEIFADEVDDDEIFHGTTSEAEDPLQEDYFSDWRLWFWYRHCRFAEESVIKDEEEKQEHFLLIYFWISITLFYSAMREFRNVYSTLILVSVPQTRWNL